jgi:geranylgeranyl transferase type-2 subunit alpha
MFHGRKKEAQKVPSAEEIAKNQEKLDKIVQINKQLLKKRAEMDYSEQALAQTEKYSFLAADFYTLWNYRREIITHLFEKMDSA